MSQQVSKEERKRRRKNDVAKINLVVLFLNTRKIRVEMRVHDT